QMATPRVAARSRAGERLTAPRIRNYARLPRSCGPVRGAGDGCRVVTRDMLTAREREVIHQIVVALLPSFPPLDDEARERVTRDAASVLASQIAGRQTSLRQHYRDALAAFHPLPLLRSGRSIPRL